MKKYIDKQFLKDLENWKRNRLPIIPSRFSYNFIKFSNFILDKYDLYAYNNIIDIDFVKEEDLDEVINILKTMFETVKNKLIERRNNILEEINCDEGEIIW